MTSIPRPAVVLVGVQAWPPKRHEGARERGPCCAEHVHVVVIELDGLRHEEEVTIPAKALGPGECCVTCGYPGERARCPVCGGRERPGVECLWCIERLDPIGQAWAPVKGRWKRRPLVEERPAWMGPKKRRRKKREGAVAPAS